MHEICLRSTRIFYPATDFRVYKGRVAQQTSGYFMAELWTVFKLILLYAIVSKLYHENVFVLFLFASFLVVTQSNVRDTSFGRPAL